MHPLCPQRALRMFFWFMLLSPRKKISSAVQDRLWRLLAPWPLGVFRYRLFRLYLSTDCTSMLNLPMSSHKKIRKENRACYFTSHLYRVSSPSLSPLLFTGWASDRTRSGWCNKDGHRDESHAPLRSNRDTRNDSILHPYPNRVLPLRPSAEVQP